MSEYIWRVQPCGNPNKAWLCDAKGKKLTRLMSVGLAGEICRSHNITVQYLETMKPQSQTNKSEG